MAASARHLDERAKKLPNHRAGSGFKQPFRRRTPTGGLYSDGAYVRARMGRSRRRGGEIVLAWNDELVAMCGVLLILEKRGQLTRDLIGYGVEFTRG